MEFWSFILNYINKGWWLSFKERCIGWPPKTTFNEEYLNELTEQFVFLTNYPPESYKIKICKAQSLDKPWSSFCVVIVSIVLAPNMEYVYKSNGCSNRFFLRKKLIESTKKEAYTFFYIRTHFIRTSGWDFAKN